MTVDAGMIEIKNEVGDLRVMLAQILQHLREGGPIDDQIGARIQERFQEPFKNQMKTKVIGHNLPGTQNLPARRNVFKPRFHQQENQLARYMVQDSDSSDEDVHGYFGIQERRENRQGRYQYHQEAQECKMKVDFPSFDGRMEVEAFLDWVKKVEIFFEYASILEEKKVKLVAFKLQRGASAWWDQLERNRRYYGKPPIRNWPKLLNMMKKRFLPMNYHQILYNQYQLCK